MADLPTYDDMGAELDLAIAAVKGLEIGCKTKRESDLKRFRIMVSRAGLEPATTALKVRCSTN